MKDYRKADSRLRKQKLKTRQQEHSLYGQECEIAALKHKNEEQLQTMMQFD